VPKTSEIVSWDSGEIVEQNR